MPVFETSGGARIEISLPRTKWTEFEEAAEAYRQLLRERKVTSTRLRSLVNSREKAIVKDRAALAVAIREGKPDPGDKTVEKIEKEMQACKRRLEALEHALDDAESDLVAVVDDHRDGWLPETEEALAKAREEYAERVEEVAKARARVSAAWGLAHWLRHFPNEEVGAISYRVRSSLVPPLKSQNGDPYPFETVISALRDDAQPAPATPPVIPWGASATEMLANAKESA
jgi:hypothetical protein